MLDNIEDEMKKYIKDLRKNVKDPLVLTYLLNRTEKLYDVIFKELETLIEEIETEDFEITCPYCNAIFDAYIDEKNDEIICPECNNVIELDWGNSGKK